MVFKTNGFDRVREPVHINEGEGDFAVSDGLHVLLPQSATGLFDPLRERGYEPIGMDLSELLKGGGSVKCCTQELRV